MLKEHTEGFVAARNAQPCSIQSTFNAKVSKIAKRYSDPVKKTLLSQTCNEPLPSHLKLLPKDHKPGPLKGRPIVAAVDAPAARLPRFLASELYPLLRQAIPAHLDSTSSFLQAIAGVELSSNSEFASLDIVNLYGSIPLEDGMFPGALSIVTQFFDAHKGGTLLAPVTKEDFTALLRLSLTSDTIQVNSKRCKQVSGIQMN